MDLACGEHSSWGTCMEPKGHGFPHIAYHHGLKICWGPLEWGDLTRENEALREENEHLRRVGAWIESREERHARDRSHTA